MRNSVETVSADLEHCDDIDLRVLKGSGGLEVVVMYSAMGRVD